MELFVPLILIIIGVVAIFYIRPKTLSSVKEMKYMKTKTIAELKDMFKQMDDNGLGDNYREFVELKGKVSPKDLVETPFSNRQVAYCESKLTQVTETKKQYKDTDGIIRTKVTKHENEISNAKTSQEIRMVDNSTNEDVVVEINAIGCKLDITKTFDIFEPKNNLSNYKYFNKFSYKKYDEETLGFKMTEETIEPNQNLYVIGEAFKVGDTIHIGKPQDNKKPFIVTTKSEEDIINKTNENSKFALIGGIIAIVVGVIMLFT